MIFNMTRYVEWPEESFPAGNAPFTICVLGKGELAAALGAEPKELPRHGEDSFCCGAGGGLMWTEESLGTRINHLRTDEVIASGAPLAAAACPFCLTMLRDGLKDKGRDDVAVKDLAQIVAERIR